MASDDDEIADDDSERSKVVDLATEKSKRRPKARAKVVEPSAIFRHITDEFNETEVEIGPEDGHWYGPGTTDG